MEMDEVEEGMRNVELDEVEEGISNAAGNGPRRERVPWANLVDTIADEMYTQLKDGESFEDVLDAAVFFLESHPSSRYIPRDLLKKSLDAKAKKVLEFSRSLRKDCKIWEDKMDTIRRYDVEREKMMQKGVERFPRADLRKMVLVKNLHAQHIKELDMTILKWTAEIEQLVKLASDLFRLGSSL